MQVQNQANYMPESQTKVRLLAPCSRQTSSRLINARFLQRVLAQNLGESWREHFDTFDMVPFAAASIGQVHRATLAASSPLASHYPPSMPLAVKVQFPGVRESISSDLSNLKWLLVASSVLPRGLYLENTIKVMERELDEECDYEREAECGVRMRALLQEHLADEFAAPLVVRELSGPMVLTTEMMQGRPLKEALHLDQRTKDEVRVTIVCAHACAYSFVFFRLAREC